MIKLCRNAVTRRSFSLCVKFKEYSPFQSMLCIFVWLCAHMNVFSFTHSSLLSIHLNNALHACKHILYSWIKEYRISFKFSLYWMCCQSEWLSMLTEFIFCIMFVYLRIYGMEFVILLVTGVFVCGFACYTFSTVCFSFL